MNLHLILQMARDAMGHRIGVVDGSTRLTYTEMATRASHLATCIKQNQRLIYFAENSPLFSISLFAAALRGTPFIPINYRLATDRIASLMNRVTPALLISDKNPDIEKIEHITLEDIANIQNDYEYSAPDAEGKIAIELFTSGTTGEPKSAILKHDNLMSYILNTVEFMSSEENEATLISVPPYHIAGISAVLSSVYAGRKMVLLPNFNSEEWVRYAQKEQITHAFLVPTMLQRIIEYIKKEKIDIKRLSIKAIAYGGGKMPLTVIETAMDMFPNINFTNAYGLTETSSTICLLDPETHRETYQSTDPKIYKRLSSVGKILPSIALEIRDKNGVVCPPETLGLIFVRGDQISGEYRDIGSQLDNDGWFSTKDRGYVDSEGYLFIDGRDDDVIVCGGENISPGEIEDVLLKHPEIKETAVFGIKNIEWGEVIATAIIPHNQDNLPEIDDIKEYIRCELRSSRVPSVIKFVSELPYNETGKLLRQVLRKEFSDCES